MGACLHSSKVQQSFYYKTFIFQQDYAQLPCDLSIEEQNNDVLRIQFFQKQILGSTGLMDEMSCSITQLSTGDQYSLIGIDSFL
ncbi:hypothetical protein SS50377_22767 [Spironucleus salmonicida]|uniref:Uncharacterized protein n=1 Tax=Spironucleus salmonicida TaxID=348837 RepID=V6LF26_9EUKA|nr:hypothetical protein SS50377_22767 [Spironucleus salmonicida]|eukprot:EST42281.1 Hypothetical protein SS50377_18149 [Spironucleus salmonicida]